MSERQREKQREHNQERHRLYRERNHEKILERKRIYRERNREKIRAADRRYYAHNREKILAQMAARLLADAEYATKRRVQNAYYNLLTKIRKMTDYKFYANTRAKHREYLRKHRDKTRQKEYRPMLSMRYPDWATMGASVLDVRSQFLAANLTPSQRAFARELAIERKEWRDR